VTGRWTERWTGASISQRMVAWRRSVDRTLAQGDDLTRRRCIWLLVTYADVSVCRRNMVGSLSRGMPKVVDYR
jgi:hypothetical protein